MTDIVDRLRENCHPGYAPDAGVSTRVGLLSEAADLIEAQRAEIAQLRHDLASYIKIATAEANS